MTNVVVVFLDVGQGDCTVAVDNENGYAMLIDCPAGRGSDAIRALRSLGVTRLSLAFVSHSDMDHLGGIYETVNSVSVDTIRVNLDSVVSGGSVAEKTKLQAALRAFAGLEDRGVAVMPCYAGESAQVGDFSWRALSPTHRLLLLAQGRGDRNIGSISLRLEAEKVRILIAGDAPAGAFVLAKDRGEDIGADIFRLAHHGGRIDQIGGPTIGELLDEIGAKYHIVSVGAENQYGHPSSETLIELGRRAQEARVLCTEINKTCLGRRTAPVTAAETLPPSSLLGAGGRPGGCRCAGSVSVHISAERWSVEPDPTDHDRVIATLEQPACRSVL